MDISDPTSRRADMNANTLSEVATLVRAAARLANAAAGLDVRSRWLDVLAETVTAAGYLEEYPDRSDVAGLDTADDPEARPEAPEARALATLERAADALDGAPARGGYNTILIRAALTDAIGLARQLQP